MSFGSQVAAQACPDLLHDVSGSVAAGGLDHHEHRLEQPLAPHDEQGREERDDSQIDEELRGRQRQVHELAADALVSSPASEASSESNAPAPG
jgi:hypothetical protein